MVWQAGDTDAGSDLVELRSGDDEGGRVVDEEIGAGGFGGRWWWSAGTSTCMR